MRRLLAAVCVAACGTLLVAQGPLTPIANLMGTTDTAGNLNVLGRTVSGSAGPLTPIGNLLGRTDSAGNLNVTLVAGSSVTASFISTGTGLAVANVGANSCGTSAATIAGGNNAFAITVGATSGTQCRVTFTFAAANEWDCVFADQTTTIAIRATPVDTTHTDAIGSFTAADKVTGICLPR